MVRINGAENGSAKENVTKQTKDKNLKDKGMANEIKEKEFAFYV